MSDTRLNKTGLRYFYGRIKSLFATKAEVTALSGRVDDIVSEGGEPNTISSISVNGTNIAPDGNKNVAIIVPTSSTDLSDGNALATKTYVDENGGKIDVIKVNGTTQIITDKSVDISVPTQVSDLSDGNTVATKSYVDDNGGKIDKIKVNGTEQTITSKEVDITIPTKTSDITNDSDFQTSTDVSAAIGTAIASAYKYKGSVATYAALPDSGVESGDVYDVQETGMNYAWNGTAWDALGQYVDTSLFWKVEDLTAITTAEIDEIVDETESGS